MPGLTTLLSRASLWMLVAGHPVAVAHAVNALAAELSGFLLCRFSGWIGQVARVGGGADLDQTHAHRPCGDHPHGVDPNGNETHADDRCIDHAHGDHADRHDTHRNDPDADHSHGNDAD